MAWYDLGLIAVTNNSTTVTGTGTDFISGAQVGEALYINDDLYEISAIVSATELTLADAYLGSTASGLSYKIIPTQSLVADLSAGVADLISDFADVRDYAGNGKFDDGTVSSPAITFTQDQNNGLYRIGSDNWGLVAGGSKQVDISTTDVELNHSGSKKLSTTATGVDVTGTVTADGLTVDGDVSTGGLLSAGQTANLDVGYITGTSYPAARISGYRNSGSFASTMNLSTMNTTGSILQRVGINSNGDVKFYEDTGTTAKMVWDASAESLGIGTSTPDAPLNIKAPQVNLDASDVWGSLHAKFDNTSNLNYGGYCGLGFATATADNYGFSLGAVRKVSSGTPSFVIKSHNNDATGSDVLTIDSTGNVGIGTASPSYQLTIEDSTDAVMQLKGSDLGRVYFGDSASDNVGRIQYYHIDNSMQFYTNGTKQATIDSSGNVGIGTNSPIAKLTVDGQVRASGTAGYGFNSPGDTDGGMFSPSDGVVSFKTNGSERARIDSSGNLLVGQTTANSSTNGIGMLSNGRFYSTTTDAFSSLFSRRGDDGDILRFQKDSTTVGSIGTSQGSMYIGSDDTGLLFRQTLNAIYPSDTTNPFGSNGVLNLGGASQRFKDLYLSGGVYLGGTGAANKLDDYETGSWTPSYIGTTTNPTITYDSIRDGRYTKIGNLVVATFIIRTDSVSGGSGDLNVSGLPFTVVATLSYNAGTVSIAEVRGFASTPPLSGRPSQGNTVISLQYRSSATATSESQVPISVLATGVNSNTLAATITYYTTDS